MGIIDKNRLVNSSITSLMLKYYVVINIMSIICFIYESDLLGTGKSAISLNSI